MKKLLKIWDKTAEWLCKFDGDKYVHFVVGLVTAFVFAWLMSVTTVGYPAVNYAASGMIAAAIIMVIKEVVDFIRGEQFDMQDILFGIIGGVLGTMLYLL